MSHPPDQPGEVNPIRRKAHLMANVKKVISYMEYVGTKKWKTGIEAGKLLHELILQTI